MAEIQPEIRDGIKFWNIVDDKKLTYTDGTGKVWKGKQAFNRKFEDNLIAILKSEEARLGRPLKKPEISALRRHKDIGMWLVDGDAASVQSVNAFVESLDTDSGGFPKQRKKLSLSVPKSNNKYFTREFIESKEFRDTYLKKWYARLDKQGWPPGTSKKGFIKYLQDSYSQTDAYNKILEKRLGFKFQAGHIWGSMGPIGDRTTIGPYGTFSGGKFTLRNVTSQPAKPTFKQLTSKAWGIITGNVPSRFDKRGVQIENAADLLEAGFGGQGWDGALVDYLTQGLGDIDHLDAWDRAYIAFGDPSKGDFIGKTVEARKAQILTPGLKDEILKQAADFGETAENLSGGVKTSNVFDRILDQPNLLGDLSRDQIDKVNTIHKLPVSEQRAEIKDFVLSEKPNILDNNLFKQDSATTKLLKAAYRNPAVKATGLFLGNTLSTIAKPLDPLMTGINAYAAYNSNDMPSRLMHSWKTGEGAFNTAAWFTPKAFTPALIMSGASALAEAQDPKRVQDVTGEKDWTTPVLPGAVTTGVLPVGMENPFKDWFKKSSNTEQLLTKTTVNQENKESGEENPIETSLPVLNQF